MTKRSNAPAMVIGGEDVDRAVQAAMAAFDGPWPRMSGFIHVSADCE